MKTATRRSFQLQVHSVATWAMSTRSASTHVKINSSHQVTGLSWAGLGWADWAALGLGWAGLGCARLDWIGLDLTGLDWAGPNLTGLDWTGLDWTGLDQT